MAQILMQYTSCLIVLTICIDKGDGRWKRKDTDELEHDIDVFKVMAEKVEREINEFYENNFGEQIKTGDTGKIKEKHAENIRGLEKDNDVVSHVGITRTNDNFTHSNNIINVRNPKHVPSAQFVEHHENHNDITGAIDEIKKSHINIKTKSKWPQFDEILLAMGKQYDWKNDRWIKVKRKLRKPILKKPMNSLNDHETHKFSYRTVKLNGSKSRRNVVIAVTAVT